MHYKSARLCATIFRFLSYCLLLLFPPFLVVYVSDHAFWYFVSKLFSVSLWLLLLSPVEASTSNSFYPSAPPSLSSNGKYGSACRCERVGTGSAFYNFRSHAQVKLQQGFSVRSQVRVRAIAGLSISVLSSSEPLQEWLLWF